MNYLVLNLSPLSFPYIYIYIFFFPSLEIQLALDQVFMSRVLNELVNITVQAETFPKIFQQPSLASNQVSCIFHYLLLSVN